MYCPSSSEGINSSKKAVPFDGGEFSLYLIMMSLIRGSKQNRCQHSTESRTVSKNVQKPFKVRVALNVSSSIDMTVRFLRQYSRKGE